MERIKITDFEEGTAVSKTGKNAGKAYSFLTIQLDDGQSFRIIGEAKKLVEEHGVGDYDATIEPSKFNPKYSNITELKIAGSGAPSNGSGVGYVPNASNPPSLTPPVVDHYRENSFTAQYCVQAAASIAIALINAHKSLEGVDLVEQSGKLAERLIRAAKTTNEPNGLRSRVETKDAQSLEEAPF